MCFRVIIGYRRIVGEALDRRRTSNSFGTLDVIGHSPWSFSGPILQILLLGEIGRQLI